MAGLAGWLAGRDALAELAELAVLAGLAGVTGRAGWAGMAGLGGKRSDYRWEGLIFQK